MISIPKAFTLDGDSKLGIARDQRDSGLVVYDPSSSQSPFARHLDRNLSIHMRSIEPFLSPVLEAEQIRTAVERYREWLTKAPRLRELRIAEEKAELLRVEAEGLQIEQRAEADRVEKARLRGKIRERLRQPFLTLGVREDKLDGILDDVIRLQLETAVGELAAGIGTSKEVHDRLRKNGLGSLSARGYEIQSAAYPGEVLHAFGAARSWRAAGLPLNALRVLDPFTAAPLSKEARGILLTITAAALTDLGQLRIARQCANEAQRYSAKPEFPEAVLARISSLEGRFEEAYVRFSKVDDGARICLENNRRWKVGYEHYLRSARWTEIRSATLRVQDRCELCGGNSRLDVHHKTYDRFGGDERAEDLSVLCRECHQDAHDWRKDYFGRLAESLKA